MPTVVLQETYDLSTATDKMGLLAVHTPSMNLLKRLYPGLVLQYKFVRPVTCDIGIACASMLPSDPLQVGTETGQIAPQDLFNPILYRAISTESFNTLFNRIYGGTDIATAYGNVKVGSVAVNPVDGFAPFPTLDASGQESLYYGLLSEDGWRKAMPQAGLQMRSLVPLVHYVVSTFGNARMPSTPNGFNYEDITSSTGDSVTATDAVAQILRGGKTIPLPRIPTLQTGTFVYANSDATANPDWSIPVGTINQIPKCWCAAIVFPPSKLHRLFFRMTVRWVVEFTDLCSIVERGSLLSIMAAGDLTHNQDYTIGNSKSDDITEKMDVAESTVDGLGVTAKMIMQS